MPHVVGDAHAQLRGSLRLGGIEDVEGRNWVERVYRPDILERMETIYRKPGYNPL